jgi:hypothetical protein
VIVGWASVAADASAERGEIWSSIEAQEIIDDHLCFLAGQLPPVQRLNVR